MAQTHVRLLVCITFSTKNRTDFIAADIEEELYAISRYRYHERIETDRGKRYAEPHTSFGVDGETVALPILVGDVKHVGFLPPGSRRSNYESRYHSR